MKNLRSILAIIVSLMFLVASFTACGRSVEDHRDEKEYAQEAEKTDTQGEESEVDDGDAKESDVSDNAEQDSGEDVEADIPETTPDATPEATPEAAPEVTPEAAPEASSGNSEETASDVGADEALGIFNGSTYTNDFFKFNMKFPDEWTILNREQLLFVFSIGAEFYKQNNSESDVIDIAMAQVIPLFMVSGNPLSNTGMNFNINGVANNLGIASELVKSPADYITYSTAFMKSQGMEATTGEISTITIADHEFAKTDVILAIGNEKNTQTMYVTLSGDHAIVFTLTYYSEDEKKQLEDVIRTIEFK